MLPLRVSLLLLGSGVPPRFSKVLSFSWTLLFRFSLVPPPPTVVVAPPPAPVPYEMYWHQILKQKLYLHVALTCV